MTTAFEHLITLGSFILALGIASILMSVAMLVHRRADVKLSAPLMLWMFATFLEQASFWLGSYNYRQLEDASLVEVVFVVLYPTLLFLQSALVSPQQEVSLDMVEHHRRNHRYYCGIATVCAVIMFSFFYWAGFIVKEAAVPPLLLVLTATQGLVALTATLARGRGLQLVAAAAMAGLSVTNFISASIVLIDS